MVTTVPVVPDAHGDIPTLAAFTEAFNVLDDPLPQDDSLPAFMVSKTRGFLPRLVCIQSRIKSPFL